jgi:hypothetical protein
MKLFCLAGALALLAVLVGATASPAATIQEIEAVQFDPTNTDFYASGFGQLGYYLTWNNVGANNQFLTGQPARAFAHTPAAGNPSWLDFQSISTGGTGRTGPADPLTTPTRSIYQLGAVNHQAWSMDFSVLLYDPSFDGTDMSIELQGSVNGSGTSNTNFKSIALSKTDVNGGVMVKWRIDAAADETVSVAVTSFGDESYAAGFFIDSATGSGTTGGTTALVPEPATLCLLGLGLSTLIVRRRRH